MKLLILLTVAALSAISPGYAETTAELIKQWNASAKECPLSPTSNKQMPGHGRVRPDPPECTAYFETEARLKSLGCKRAGPAWSCKNAHGQPIGWAKEADVYCDNTGCGVEDNYTDEHKKGGQCATFAIPVYDRPNGKPTGELVTDIPIVLGERRQGYIFLFFSPDVEGVSLMPFDPEDLRKCG
jgi:hypothetical protein